LEHEKRRKLVMNITSHIGEVGIGHVVNYKLFEPSVPSKNYLICLHGIGERGPADGSMLHLVEKLGYPKHAKNGFEFPFNIVAPQVVTSYAAVKKFLPGFIKLKYNADVIIVTGLSMGGYGTFDTQTYDVFRLVYAIAPVCGGGNATAMKAWPEVNGWVFHGENDTTVKYQSSKGPVDVYNATHTKQIKYTLYPGVGHNAWDKAYSVTAGSDELLQQIIKWFNEAPKPNAVDAEAIKTKIINYISQL
jgi:predicted peptidase